MIAASASGLSMTRWEPNVRCRSSVTRKTPPSTPTSSPRTSTSASRSISWKSAWLSALTMFTLAMASASRQPLAAHRRGSGLVRGCLVRTRRYRVLTSRRLVALGSEIGRQLGVHVVEHRQRVRGRRRLEAANRLGNLVVDPLLEPLFEKVPLLQIRAEAGERVLLLPHRDFRLAPVLGRVVGGRVHAQAIGHALDQGRTVAGASTLDRLARRGVDREDVVAVDLDAGEPVCQRLLRDRARVRLLFQRHRDRLLVVLAHEDDRDVPDAGEVQRLVEVALGGRAVAEVRHHDHVVAAVLRGVGEADGVRKLGRDRDRDRQIALLGSRLAAFEVAREEEQELLDRPAPPDHRRRLAERRHHPVGRAQAEDASYLRGFLALGGREGPDASLTLEPHHALVQSAAEQHRAIERPQIHVGELGLERGVEVAVAVEDRQVFDLEAWFEGDSGHDGPKPILTLGTPNATSSPRRLAWGGRRVRRPAPTAWPSPEAASRPRRPAWPGSP